MKNNIEQIYVLSIAGFDPSGGAGITADIKTFESYEVIGLGVCSAITFQNENEFDGLEWVQLLSILKQLEILTRKYTIEYVKIGIVESLETLDTIINTLVTYNPNIKIIWDPILKASAGFEFHHEINKTLFQSILSKIYLLTPNYKEVKILFGEADLINQLKLHSHQCNILLKGGHIKQKEAIDTLFYTGKSSDFIADRIIDKDKHGTGCVLSASITSLLALEYDLIRACIHAKKYLKKYLQSSDTLLGFHSKE